MQRRRVLSAFVYVVGERGLETASVGEVCAQAGMSRRTFYELFSDRESCMLAAFEDTLQRLATELEAVYRSSGAWQTRVRAALSVLLERFDADPPMARMCMVETLRAGPEVQALRARTIDALAAIVDEGRSEAVEKVLPMTAQGVVGGVLAVLHTQLYKGPKDDLGELAGSLTAMILQPYLGPSRAERELSKPSPTLAAGVDEQTLRDPFKGLSIRFTYRTALVLATIASLPGASNREVSDGADISDEGQTSRLLARLRNAGLIANGRDPEARGEPNAWSLTDRGQAIHATLAG